MGHSCVSRNPGCVTPARGLLCGSGSKAIWTSPFLDSRLRGNDTLGLARQGRGELPHSAKLLLTSLFCNKLWPKPSVCVYSLSYLFIKGYGRFATFG